MRLSSTPLVKYSVDGLQKETPSLVNRFVKSSATTTIAAIGTAGIAGAAVGAKLGVGSSHRDVEYLDGTDRPKVEYSQLKIINWY